ERAPYRPRLPVPPPRRADRPPGAGLRHHPGRPGRELHAGRDAARARRAAGPRQGAGHRRRARGRAGGGLGHHRGGGWRRAGQAARPRAGRGDAHPPRRPGARGVHRHRRGAARAGGERAGARPRALPRAGPPRLRGVRRHRRAHGQGGRVRHPGLRLGPRGGDRRRLLRGDGSPRGPHAGAVRALRLALRLRRAAPRGL
ncbi:MAG: Septum formation protein Maf, partial [uncultured Gemmatimonadetes bacterium]